MNFLEQQEDFARKAQDVDASGTPNYVYFPQAFVKSLLNQAFQEITRKVPGGLKRFVQLVQDPTAMPDVGAGTAAPYNYMGLYVPQLAYTVNEYHSVIVDGTLELTKMTSRQAFTQFANWNNITGDTPVCYVTDVKQGAAFLVQQPTEALSNIFAEVTLQHPVLTANTSTCELPLPYHALPVHLALAAAYKADAGDTYDPQKAGMWAATAAAELAEYAAQVGRDFNAGPTPQRGVYF